MSSSKIIAAEDIERLQRWSAPRVGVSREQQTAEEVETVRLPTAEEVAAIEQAAYQEGFERGLREGREAARKELQERVSHLDHIMAGLTHPLSQVNDEVEDELVALAIAMARQLIRRELQSDPKQIVAVVREALKALPSDARRVQLFLHPEDACLVHELMAVTEGDGPLWKVVDDGGLTRGGCRVQSEYSRIDATVEKRLNNVISQLLGGERSGDQPDIEE